MINSETDTYLREAYEAGVVYFADDDNAYDLQLFAEIRKVKRIGVWPVGSVSGFLFQRCVVDARTGKIRDYIPWRGARYPIDTSGFGIHVGFFLPYSSNAPRWDPNSEKRFGLETDFLTQFGLPLSDFEPLASNCTEVNVWHVRTDHHVSSDGLMRQLVNFNA